MTAPEFSRPVRLDTLGDAPRAMTIAADEAERAALAARFDLIALDRLEAEARLTRDGDTFIAEGRVRATVTQRCVATGRPLDVDVDTPFALRFVPEGAAPGEEQVELDEDELDVMTYVGGAVDLGEAAAETMALALDPYPRAPDADAALKAAGVLAEGEAGPFAGLKALKDRLG